MLNFEIYRNLFENRCCEVKDVLPLTLRKFWWKEDDFLCEYLCFVWIKSLVLHQRSTNYFGDTNENRIHDAGHRNKNKSILRVREYFLRSLIWFSPIQVGYVSCGFAGSMRCSHYVTAYRFVEAKNSAHSVQWNSFFFSSNCFYRSELLWKLSFKHFKCQTWPHVTVTKWNVVRVICW